MKTKSYIHRLSIMLILVMFSLLTSCQDWLELEEPDNKLVSSKVFASDETAQSAMQGIYNQLYRASFSEGWLGSVTVLSGLSSDNVELINTNALDLLQFEQHVIHPENTFNRNLWSSAYNIIYMVNSLLEGLEKSTEVSPELSQRLEGEATFIRAFTYFYLRNLFGEVPLVLNTNYEANASIEASSILEIDEHILADLETSLSLLAAVGNPAERTQINEFTAKALLARIHLYLENWELAEAYSTEVIAQSGNYSLPTDMNEVFLANSQEAIWQISPIGAGTGLTNTNEGSVFLINAFLPSLSYLKISENLVSSLAPEDKRRIHWVGYNEDLAIYYAHKYKIQNSTGEPVEYSMVMRLAEQYLIRAEARANQNNLQGAITDLDTIKARAGIVLISETNPGIDQQALLKEILRERRKELFAEWGHRWLDLIRLEKAEKIFSPINTTDLFYPIPSEELLRNPFLNQNPGY